MTEHKISREWREALIMLGIVQLHKLCQDKCGEEWRMKHELCNDNYEEGSPAWAACITAAAEDYLKCANACPPKKIPIELPWSK